ncbi:MAG: IclR family transcriptional regulator [Salaquimonas sp.]
MLESTNSKQNVGSPNLLDVKSDVAVSEIAPAGAKQIQSVNRALTILEVLASEGGALPLSELAMRSQLNQSTCHHLISTLVGRGYLAHLGRNRGYALGQKFHELADLTGRQSDLGEVLKSGVEALSEQLGHSVQLAILSDTSLMTKLRVTQSVNEVTETDEITKMTALHATATGKAMLAWLPDTELARVVAANGLTGYTANTITSLSGLMQELGLVRRNGYAVDDEELKDGVVCIGSALREMSGAVVASISVTVSAEQATPVYRKKLSKSIVQAAQKLSKQL